MIFLLHYLVIQNSEAREIKVENKYEQQFKKGSLEMILLTLISAKETYGYEIITNLNEKGGRIFGYTREGTVYPVLYRLEKSGLIKSRTAPSSANGGTKKYYSVTEEGKAALGAMKSFWQDYVECVNSFITLSEEEKNNDK